MIIKRVPVDEIIEDSENTAWLGDSLFTGVAFENHAVGYLWSELHFVDGRLTKAQEWHPNGQLKTVTSYQHDVKHSQEDEWYEGGTQRSTATYEFGILLNKKTWLSDGTIDETYSLPSDDPKRDLLRKFHARY